MKYTQENSIRLEENRNGGEFFARYKFGLYLF